MAYKQNIEAWHDIDLTKDEVNTIRAIIEGAYKRAGARGALPSILSLKNVLKKGSFSVDAAAFIAGNVQEAPAQIMSKPLSKLAAPSSVGGADNGLAEKLATIEKALAMLLTQGSATSHAPSATLPAPQTKTSKRKAA
jgi:hypothetical protein